MIKSTVTATIWSLCIMKDWEGFSSAPSSMVHVYWRGWALFGPINFRWDAFHWYFSGKWCSRMKANQHHPFLDELSFVPCHILKISFSIQEYDRSLFYSKNSVWFSFGRCHKPNYENGSFNLQYHWLCNEDTVHAVLCISLESRLQIVCVMQTWEFTWFCVALTCLMCQRGVEVLEGIMSAEIYQLDASKALFIKQ